MRRLHLDLIPGKCAFLIGRTRQAVDYTGGLRCRDDPVWGLRARRAAAAMALLSNRHSEFRRNLSRPGPRGGPCRVTDRCGRLAAAAARRRTRAGTSPGGSPAGPTLLACGPGPLAARRRALHSVHWKNSSRPGLVPRRQGYRPAAVGIGLRPDRRPGAIARLLAAGGGPDTARRRTRHAGGSPGRRRRALHSGWSRSCDASR